MAGAEDGHKFDHVVSVMFENRTFDNLLGRLYQPGEVPSFEGVIGKHLSNPIPEWAEHGADRKVVPYGVAANMNTPNPDSGEEFTHINTQLFGVIDPPGNRGVMSEQMAAPFNAPGDPHATPTMDGFVGELARRDHPLEPRIGGAVDRRHTHLEDTDDRTQAA